MRFWVYGLGFRGLGVTVYRVHGFKAEGPGKGETGALMASTIACSRLGPLLLLQQA